MNLSTEELHIFNNLRFYNWAALVFSILQFEEWGFWAMEQQWDPPVPLARMVVSTTIICFGPHMKGRQNYAGRFP